MTRDMWSSIYVHNSRYLLLLSQFILKIEYEYFNNSVIYVSAIS